MHLSLKRAARVERTENHDGFEVIHTQNTLRRQALVFSKTAGVMDNEAIAKAERAIEKLSSEFEGWMRQELERLEAEFTSFKADPRDAAKLAAFHRAAHDMKGQAPTLGYPLAGQVADSLCMLLEKIPQKRIPVELTERHVEAISAIVRQNALGASDQTGLSLAQRLRHVSSRTVEALAPRSTAGVGGPKIEKA